MCARDSHALSRPRFCVGWPLGDRGRRRSKFVLYRRQKANGVVRSRHYPVKTPQSAQAIHNNQLHSISYTLSRNQAVIVEYTHDPATDLFQVRPRRRFERCFLGAFL